jgi:hypothetical protein
LFRGGKLPVAEEVRKTLAVLEADDYVGEMALVNQKPRAAARGSKQGLIDSPGL